jgi:hypothetical protein
MGEVSRTPCRNHEARPRPRQTLESSAATLAVVRAEVTVRQGYIVIGGYRAWSLAARTAKGCHERRRRLWPAAKRKSVIVRQSEEHP